MKIAVAGGTGFIGSALVARLRERGDDVLVLERGQALARDVVINLAGENVGRRWTAERKRRILDSRIRTTNALVDAHPPVRGSKNNAISRITGLIRRK